MRKTLFSAFLCTFMITAQAQVQQDWARKCVGSGMDNAAAIAADRLGNVWICGNNNWGLGTEDMYAVRYNSAGTQTAGFLYNSSNSEQARAITTDASSNVYVVGTTSVSGGPKDITLVKYNSSAVQQWMTTFNTPQNYNDDAAAVAVDASGNVYITGSVVKANAFEYDYLTVKFNSAGVMQWYVFYNGTANGVDMANDIAVDAAGNVYVTGLSAGQVFKRLFTVNTGYDYVTIKYNANGVQQWVQRYNASSGNDEAKAIALDASGNVYVTGHSPATSSGNYDCATIKYDNNGTLLWLQRYAGSAGVNDEGNDIAVDGSNNVYVSGYANSGNGTSNVLGLKYNSAGTPVWTGLYSSGSGSQNIGVKMGLDAYANMYIVASTSAPGLSNDYLTIKFTSGGALSWAVKYNSPENAYDMPTGIAVVMPNAPPGTAV
ncbi:MAG TPA: SBBP repeat-containing protein, partial [Chitinophagaceae bacterium]|nr:SBBP repeat-containing protein [Chitinophagaceae bacterium]